MVNIEQITSTLAKLPDQALQRYAMMHKDDPYIVSLAVSESKRRKEMRAAGQGMQGMQPQPKVADQAFADMAPRQAQPMPQMPEEQGIGALPAAAQMNFADGGITGYADGGYVERYQSQGLVQPLNFNERAARQMREKGSIYDPYFGAPEEERRRMKQEDDLKKAQSFASGSLSLIQSNAKAMSDSAQARITELEQNREELTRKFGPRMYEQALGRAQQELNTANARGSELVNQQTQTGQARIAAATPLPFGSNFAPVNPADVAGSPVPAPLVATEKAATAPPKVDATKRSLSGAPTPSAAQPSAAQTPAQSIEDRFLSAQKKMTDETNPFAIQQREIADTEETLARDRAAGIVSRQEMFKDAFKGRETRLEDRAKALEKSKDTNTGLAFLEAGLAIMSTPGALATAIGKGAREGTARYASGIEKLRAAQDKLDDAKDRMEELKLNRAEMSAKERMEAELDIQRTVLSGKKDALASSQKLFGDRSALSQAIVKTSIDVEQKDLDRTATREEKEKDRRTQVQTAGIGQRIALETQDKFVKDWMAKPENKGKTFSDAYAAFRAAGAPATATRGVMTRDQAADNVAKALEPGMDRTRTINEATAALAAMGIANPTLAQIKEHLIQEQMRGSGVGAASTGIGAPPPGAVRLKPSGG
jgi:hypothetical protein